MVIEKGGLTARLRPPIVDIDPLMVLLVHGWTGDEQSMGVFARSMPKNCWLVAPRAPFATEDGGYSWVESPHSLDVPFEEFVLSANRLVEWVDRLDEIPVSVRQQFHLVGFSQGAALCYTLALTYPHRTTRLADYPGSCHPVLKKPLQDNPFKGNPAWLPMGLKINAFPSRLPGKPYGCWRWRELPSITVKTAWGTKSAQHVSSACKRS